ncbi:MAG: aminotransferase class V-fold PLP-dependent enzyme [Acidimicrobiia bacterium]|nr:aminotransferase class V-fold PLP-dependent enzyme [Acidimicrobiia bacterium]
MQFTPSPLDLRKHWDLDPDVTFLNHGSFGATPLAVLEYQERLRRRLEKEPVRFFQDELKTLARSAREDLGRFVGAEPDDLAFVPNATTGVNTVVRSLSFEPGDEILITNHGYNACSNAVRFAADRAGATVVTATIPFPVDGPDTILGHILEHVTPNTRLALIDHVTSPTALVFPIGRIVSELMNLGVDTLVDGAHAPGMVDLDIEAIGAAYYTANCHKWMCAPKGTAFLHVREDLQDRIVPTTISHGANSPDSDTSRFRLLFDWTGTHDPTPYLSIPTAIATLDSLLEGGWSAVREHNHTLALAARDVLVDALGIDPPAPDSLLGSMTAVPLPDETAPFSTGYSQPLRDSLLDEFGIEVPVPSWPSWPSRLIRVSAHLYNEIDQYRALARALTEPGV